MVFLGEKCFVTCIHMWTVLVPMSGDFLTFRLTQRTAGCGLETKTWFYNGKFSVEPSAAKAHTSSRLFSSSSNLGFLARLVASQRSARLSTSSKLLLLLL